MPTNVYAVWYADHSTRDVYAADQAGALRVAKAAARATGRGGRSARPVRAEHLGQVGYGATDPVRRMPDGSQRGGAR